MSRLLSCGVLCPDMDEFDSRFDFTALDEPNMDMEMSSITARSSEG